jgi:stage V sporulation protein S
LGKRSTGKQGQSAVSQSRSIYILWSAQLDAMTATILATELRRAGLAASLLGMHARPTRSEFGIVVTPDLSLEDVLATSDPIACLIVPGKWKELRALLYDPRLLDLIDRIHREDGSVLVGSSPDDVLENYADRKLLSYPFDAALLPFAQDLAQSLLMTEFNRSSAQSQSVVLESVQRFHHRTIHRSGDSLMGDIIRVAADSQPSAVAGAIANTIREHHRAEVQAIGVSAVNQMLKATIIARRYLVENNLDLSIVPDFADVLVDERQLTALKLYVWAFNLASRNDGNRGPQLPL